MRSSPHRWLLPLAALVAVAPMLSGISCGHDFDFHLLSWLEAANQLTHGAFPHWAYTPAYNAGEPRFLFYPPLSWLLGGLLGSIVAWLAVPVVYVWIALTASGFSFYELARRYVGQTTSVVASSLYLANTYMLFTAYERSAFAELLAAAFLPWLFLTALEDRVTALSIAVPLCLLWLTNAPAAVMGSYALALLLLVRIVAAAGQARPAVRALAVQGGFGAALGLGLAGFYIVPAAYERRFVQIDMAVMAGMRASDHFLFHRMPGHTADDQFHNAVVRSASIVALLLLGASACTGTIALLQRREASGSLSKRVILPLALLAAVIGFMLTPLSAPVWAHLPELAFLQFPWRLSALLGVIFALFAALAIDRIPLRMGPALAISLALTVLLVAPAWHQFHQACDAEDAVPARVALFHSKLGTEPTDEYTPAGADADSLQPHDPPYWLVAAADDVNRPAPQGLAPGPAPDHLALQSSQPGLLILNRRQYPLWQIRVNGVVTAPHTPERDDGLITVALPAGADQVDLQIVRTWDENAGAALSAVSLLLAAWLFRRRHQASN